MDFKLIVMGGSLGGTSALKIVLSALPKDFPVPLAVVLHRGASHGDALAASLGRTCALPLLEAEDKQPILPGHVFIGPSGYHLLVEGDHLALSTEDPVNQARPSIDVLFESAADSYGRRVVGVILTGANPDGAQGMAAIRRRGGMTVVQEPATAEAPAMVEAAIAATAVDQILPLPEIGPFLVSIVRGVRHGAKT